MDLIMGFPTIETQNDSIIVVVDRLSKVVHFIPVKSSYKANDIAEMFMKDILRMHGFPKAIILDGDVKLTSNFWKRLFQELGT